MAKPSPLFEWRARVVAAQPDDLVPADLTVKASTVKHVALTLSLYMNDRGGSCWPSQETIAANTSLSKSAVVSALNALVDTGWLKRDAPSPAGRSPMAGRGHTTKYWAKYPEETVALEDRSPRGKPRETVASGDHSRNRNGRRERGNGRPDRKKRSSGTTRSRNNDDFGNGVRPDGAAVPSCGECGGSRWVYDSDDVGGDNVVLPCSACSLPEVALR